VLTRGRNCYVRSTCAWAMPPGNFCLSSQATGTTPWHHVVRRRGRSQGYLRTTAMSGQPVLLAECHAQVTQRPVDNKSSVAWELRLASKAGSTQPCCAQVTRGAPPYVPGLPRTHRKTRPPTETGPPPSTFFLLGWPGCHSHRPGRSCLSTLQAPRG
jgi:hypothetical protein